jgi:SnoaL-like domain
MSSEDPTLYQAARSEIERALLRYARGVDRQDWVLVRSAYHEDATDEHGEFRGGLDEFIRYLTQRHANIEQSIHFITNITVELVADERALVESYYFCQQRLKSAESVENAFGKVFVSGDETLQLSVSGRYIDRFERRAGLWKIADRKVAFDVLTATATPLGGGLSSQLLRSRRDGGDVLMRERTSLGLK